MIPFGGLGVVDGKEDQAQGSEMAVEVTDIDGYYKGAQADEHAISGPIA